MTRVLLACLIFLSACQNPDGSTDWLATGAAVVGAVAVVGAAVALSGDSDDDDDRRDYRNSSSDRRDRDRVLRAGCDKRYGYNARSRDWNRCLEGERHYSQVMSEGCAAVYSNSRDRRRCQERYT